MAVSTDHGFPPSQLLRDLLLWVTPALLVTMIWRITFVPLWVARQDTIRNVIWYRIYVVDNIVGGCAQAAVVLAVAAVVVRANLHLNQEGYGEKVKSIESSIN